jgi:dUTP pyrophosphatase
LPSSGRVRIALRRLPGGEGLPLPEYMSEGAAGADVCAAVDTDVTLAPGERALVPAGFTLAIPAGYEVQVRPRSGLALRHGVTLLNTPGTIDSDYRGPVGVLMINLGTEPYVVRRGERIAQLVVAPVARALFDEDAEQGETVRATGGFGSTGV